MEQPKQAKELTKYDLLYGSSQQVAIMTKASTIRFVEDVTGCTETWIVQTARHEKGDRIYVECVDENKIATRIALPFKVSAAIASQKNSLTARRRSIASKVRARAAMDRGELPGFMRKKKQA